MGKWGHIAEVVRVWALSSACGERHSTVPASKSQAGDHAAVGTAGHTDAPQGTVSAIVSAKGLPGGAVRDKDSARLWTLTQQFYQKRDNAFAWIDGRQPRSQ